MNLNDLNIHTYKNEKGHILVTITHKPTGIGVCGTGEAPSVHPLCAWTAYSRMTVARLLVDPVVGQLEAHLLQRCGGKRDPFAQQDGNHRDLDGVYLTDPVQLGKGGRGEVYVGFDQTLKRKITCSSFPLNPPPRPVSTS